MTPKDAFLSNSRNATVVIFVIGSESAQIILRSTSSIDYKLFSQTVCTDDWCITALPSVRGFSRQFHKGRQRNQVVSRIGNTCTVAIYIFFRNCSLVVHCEYAQLDFTGLCVRFAFPKSSVSRVL